jgi:hypothetical protein
MTTTTSETPVLAEYKAKTSTGASIHIVHNHLPLQVNQMVIWMLNHPEFALGLVPRWHELKADKQAFDDHAEGSAKNHGIEV